nr:MAG TPA_asm: hypothetical protein [Caudoviricetes sp.]
MKYKKNTFKIKRWIMNKKRSMVVNSMIVFGEE